MNQYKLHSDSALILQVSLRNSAMKFLDGSYSLFRGLDKSKACKFFHRNNVEILNQFILNLYWSNKYLGWISYVLACLSGHLMGKPAVSKDYKIMKWTSLLWAVQFHDIFDLFVICYFVIYFCELTKKKIMFWLLLLLWCLGYMPLFLLHLITILCWSGIRHKTLIYWKCNYIF